MFTTTSHRLDIVTLVTHAAYFVSLQAYSKSLCGRYSVTGLSSALSYCEKASKKCRKRGFKQTCWVPFVNIITVSSTLFQFVPKYFCAMKETPKIPDSSDRLTATFLPCCFFFVALLQYSFHYCYSTFIIFQLKCFFKQPFVYLINSTRCEFSTLILSQ